MKNIALSFSFLVFLFNQNTLIAQDLHSSLNPVSPQLNPAWTGILRGAAATRFQATHRKQWSEVMGSEAAYATSHASFEQNFFQGSFNFIGLGIHLSHDQAGKMPLRQIQADISGSYIMKLAEPKRHKSLFYLAAGAQISYAQRRFDGEGISWSEQFNGSNGYNLALPSGEPLSINGLTQQNRQYGDAALGVALNYVNTDKNKVLEWAQIGGSIHHLAGVLNSRLANVSQYQDSVFLLRHRYTLHTSTLLGFGKYTGWGISPTGFFTIQNKVWQAQAGTYVQWRLGNYTHFKTPNTFQLGVFSRLTGQQNTPLSMDALILATRMDIDNWTFMASYDINMSKLRAASRGQGGFEFGVICQLKGKENGFGNLFLSDKSKGRRKPGAICPY
jgi:type IX secretion system PorP/SprF family membrane protein